jgi:hypothetical protein
VATLRSNLAARDLREVPPLPELREDPGAYWARRSAMAWT